jgi:DNA-binding helix-hairpin-helix protein with protein kinase domain
VNQLGLAQKQLVMEYGDPKQLIDRQALEGRLWRNFLSHLVGHNEKVNQRQECLKRLINFATDTAAGVVTASSRLEQQRLAFTSKLYRVLYRVPAQKAGQQAPALVALKALQTKISEKDKQWFSQQLEQEIISNWMIEGLGPTRWALLRDHRIINAQQLRKSINDLTTLPGIGTVLQSRLKSQLNTVINQKRLIMAQHTWPMRLEDLVNPLEPSEFRQLEEQHIPQIHAELINMEREYDDLKQGIAIQLAQRDQLIKGFSELF